MTTKLVVLAGLLIFSCVEAQAGALKKERAERREKPRREQLRREPRVSRARRLELRATPSIEPQWPARAELVARR